MKQIDFIHKYKHLLPTSHRSQFERDMLSVFIDEEVTKQVIANDSMLKEMFRQRQEEQSKKLKDHFEQIMDIETNPLKENT